MFKEKVFDSELHQGSYLHYLCHRATENKNVPLVIYLHGTGSCGDSLSKFNHSGPLCEVDAGRDHHCDIIAPQCHANTWFELFETLLEFIDTIRNDPRTDKRRVYLTGCSMGGYTAWQIAMSRPDWFAALVPVCGGGMYWNASKLAGLPVWAFHGALDKIVLPEESVHMVAAINEAGGKAKITIYPDIAHGAWEPAFANDSTWQWMLSIVNDRIAE